MRKKNRGKTLISLLMVISLLYPLWMTENLYAKESNVTTSFDVEKLQQGITEESTEDSMEQVPEVSEEPQEESKVFSYTVEETGTDSAGEQKEQEAAEDEEPEKKTESKERTQGANDTVSANSADYFVFNSGTQTITAYSADSAAPKDIVIPEQIGGVDVLYIGAGAFRGQQLSSVTFQTTKLLEIGAYAFENNKNMGGALVIPASVTKIGEYAFAGGNKVTEITVPGSVKVIEQRAFAQSSSAVSITLSEGTTEIKQYAFSGCSRATTITLPNSIQIIGNYAFENCGKVTSIILPDRLREIGPYAFSGWGALGPEITIPASVTKIGESAFIGSQSLKSIRIPDKNDGRIGGAPWGSLAAVYWKDTLVTDGWVFNPSSKRISNYTGQETDLIMPNKFQTADGTEIPVQYFDTAVFKGNSRIKSVVIAEGVRRIPSSAFEGCRELTSVIIPDGVTEISSSAFQGCTKLTGIIIPDSVTSLSQRIFIDCTSLVSVKLPSGINSIGILTFSGCTSLREITIPEGVTEIASSAFTRCKSLESVTLPDSLVRISRSAFSGCSSLEEIIIPENVERIEYDAFSLCHALRAIRIPSKPIDGIAEAPWGAPNAVVFWNDTVQEGDWVFSIKNETITKYVGNDTAVVMPEEFTYQQNGASVTAQVTGFGASTFEGRQALQSVIITPGITSIPNRAFYNCRALTSVTIPDSVISIGDSAFQFCESLESIQIPENVTSIGSSAFQSCQKLDNVVIPSGVKAIEAYTFYSAYGLTNITLPDGLTTIGNGAFMQAKIMTSITIPETVTTIGDSAFSACYELRSITIPNSVRSIGSNAFGSCGSLTTISIPTKFSGEIPGSPWSAPKAAVVWRDTVLSEGWMFQPALKRVDQYTGNEVNLVMPSKFTVGGADIAVESFLPMVFAGNQTVESIQLAEGITQIPSGAFDSCGSLKRITLGSKVAVMPNNIFEKVTTLESVFVQQARTTSPLAPTQPWGAPSNVRVYYSGEFVGFEHTVDKVEGEYKRILRINASADGAIKTITLPDGTVENVGTNNWAAEMVIEENKVYEFKGVNTSNVEYIYEVVINDIGIPVLQSSDEIEVNWPSLNSLTDDKLVKIAQASSVTETGTELKIEISSQDVDAVKAMTSDGQEEFITLTTTNPAPWNKTVTKLIKVTLVRTKTEVRFEVNDPGLGSIDKTVLQDIWVGDVLNRNAALAKVNSHVKNAKFVGWYRMEDPSGALTYVGDNEKLKKEIITKAGITYRAVFTTALYESNNLNGPSYGVVVPTYLDVESGKEANAGVQLIQLPNGTNASGDFDPDLKVEVTVETQNNGYLVNPKDVDDKIAYEIYYGENYNNAGFKLSEGDTVIKYEKTDTTTFYRKDNGQITADIPGKAYLTGQPSGKGRFVDVLTFKLQRII